MPAILCPRCGASNPPVEGGSAGGPRCAKCRAPLPVPAEAFDGPFLGEPAGPARRPPTPRFPLSPTIRELAGGHRVAGLAPPQRVVFALLVRTLQAYRADRFMVVFGFAMMPFFAAVGLLVGLLIMVGSHVALAWAGRLAGVEAGYALYGIPLFVLVFARWIKSLETDREITLRYQGRDVDGLELGRLHEIFETSEPSTLALFFGICFGFQGALLYLAPDHAGLPIVGEPRECALLTLDNACHGIFLDTFELYNFHWGEKPEHTYRSATVFYAFRLGFDAFALLTVYGAYRRYRLRHLFRLFPNDPRRLSDLLDWLDMRCADEHAWPRQYLDEFLFLMLAREYLRGNLALVRQLSRQFPWLAVSEDVRAAFVGPDGQTAFRGRWPSTTGAGRGQG